MPARKPSKVEILSQKRLLTDFINVDRVTFRHETFAGPMSEPVERQVYRARQACAVLIWDRAIERLILVRQFRIQAHSYGEGWIIETAAGMLGDGEDPREAALREVAEETGYEVTELEHVSTFLSAPGVMTERVHLFYAEANGRARVSTGLEEEGEDIDTLAITADEARAMLQSGEICDAKTIIALQWWLSRR